jgi:hypothetical protein
MRGWVPHDDGAFAQSAERVLNGELPHRDFDELYTAGLTFINALAFRMLGINLASLRIVLFAVFLAWVPAVFYIASRFVRASAAGATTLVAVAWGVPNYAAAVPSWYNLFFAVFGAAALIRYVESGSRRWIFVAGIFGGLSIVVKVAGIYFVAAALLFFIFREQCAEHGPGGELAGWGRLYSLSLVLGLAVFVGLLASLVRKIPLPDEFIYFVLPTLVLGILLLHREFIGSPGSPRRRLRTLISMVGPFGFGVVAPVLVFLVPFCISGSGSALIRGIFVLPSRRLVFAVMAPPSFKLMIATLPICLLVFLASNAKRLVQKLLAGALAIGFLGAILEFSKESPLAYILGWHSIATAIPVIVLAGGVILGISRYAQRLTLLGRQHLMLLICITALTNLVQFPFSAPIYFCYVAPLVVLAGVAVLSAVEGPPRIALGVLTIFFLLFAVLRVTPAFIYQIGRSYAPDRETERLTLTRAGGLRVYPGDAMLYEQLIPLIQAHSAGEYVYAAPDCPEVYFLSGRRNPTRSLFDFLDYATDPAEHILTELESHKVDVVVINHRPGFSEVMAPDLRDALQKRFPHVDRVGHFEARWK